MKLKTGDIVYGTDFNREDIKREDITVDIKPKSSLKDILCMSACAVCVVYFSWLLGFSSGAVTGTEATIEASEKVRIANTTEKEI